MPRRKEIEILPACTCKWGPDIGDVVIERVYNSVTKQWKSRKEMRTKPGFQRTEDGEIIPHVHPSMMRGE